MNNINYNADVVFSGAGPVGLWTAIQIKLLNPDLQLDMLDKHADYKRSHVLQLHHESFNGCPNDPRLKAIIDEFKSSSHIRTNVIERKLNALATELGIRIHKNVPVMDPAFLPTMYPKAKVFVGADGAHSVVREKIFNNELSVDEDLKFVVEVKYEVYGKGTRLDLIKEAYPTLKIMETIAEEHVGKEENGKTPITLRLFVDKATYDSMQNATFANPIKFANKERLPLAVLNNINVWLNVKASRGEVRVLGSEKITATRLGIYSSKEFVKIEGKRAWVLVGDAGSGVPFFQSYKKGNYEGTELAKRIVKAIEGSNQDEMMAKIFGSTFSWELSYYSVYAKRLTFVELQAARVRSAGLTSLSKMIQVSAHVPWQTNYWAQAELDAFRAIHI